jgi:hypothetical protein
VIENGFYTNAAIASRKWLKDLLKEVDQVIAGMEN